jgi:hypothetical protein
MFAHRPCFVTPHRVIHCRAVTLCSVFRYSVTREFRAAAAARWQIAGTDISLLQCLFDIDRGGRCFHL